jgi:hypothetical protein
MEMLWGSARIAPQNILGTVNQPCPFYIEILQNVPYSRYFTEQP